MVTVNAAIKEENMVINEELFKIIYHKVFLPTPSSEGYEQRLKTAIAAYLAALETIKIKTFEEILEELSGVKTFDNLPLMSPRQYYKLMHDTTVKFQNQFIKVKQYD